MTSAGPENHDTADLHDSPTVQNAWLMIDDDEPRAITWSTVTRYRAHIFIMKFSRIDGERGLRFRLTLEACCWRPVDAPLAAGSTMTLAVSSADIRNELCAATDSLTP